MMSQVHLNWCADLYAEDGNSRWLLPNRIYEGGYFAIPAITFEGSETAACVRERRLGYVLPTADIETLANFIETLSAQQYGEMLTSLEATPAENFVDDGAFPRALNAILARQ